MHISKCSVKILLLKYHGDWFIPFDTFIGDPNVKTVSFWLISSSNWLCTWDTNAWVSSIPTFTSDRERKFMIFGLVPYSKVFKNPEYPKGSGFATDLSFIQARSIVICSLFLHFPIYRSPSHSQVFVLKNEISSPLFCGLMKLRLTWSLLFGSSHAEYFGVMLMCYDDGVCTRLWIYCVFRGQNGSSSTKKTDVHPRTCAYNMNIFDLPDETTQTVITNNGSHKMALF